ncbi:MAG: ATP-binding cassette domain-containing protein [Holosporaceae bacterium]|nr:MAG: ATP-binding cassette domain-containing protein [Holosporaceae bacterium]
MEAGEFIILLGSNGSGKSSLLKVLMGDVCPIKGRFDIASRCQRRYLGQSTKESLFHALTVYENIVLHAQAEGASLWKGISDTQIAYYKDYLKAFHRHLPGRLSHPVGTLSGGERQSLVLALALHSQPDLFLIDEHTSALDPKSATALMELTNEFIQASPVTTVMTTHDINHALTYGTRIIALKGGKVVLDVKEDQKKKCTRQDLLALYG